MNTKYYISIIAILFSTVIFAQETTGEISYDIDFSSDNTEAQPFLQRMENSSLTIYFSKGKLRSDMHMGDFMTTQTISIKELDSTMVFMDGMMGRIAMPSSHKNISEEDEKNRQNMMLVSDNATLEFTSDTKKIIGYNCKKVIIKTEDSESEVWYTEDILPDYRVGQFFSEKIPGTPLEINTKTMGMDVKAVAYKFKGKLKKEDAIFSIELPKGYIIRTPEEMRQMSGGRM